jgi:hypothetical protein
MDRYAGCDGLHCYSISDELEIYLLRKIRHLEHTNLQVIQSPTHEFLTIFQRFKEWITQASPNSITQFL